ncbi:hypothetical protein HNQ50_001385 [Silvimonas terrae]|uniref:Uncharacterized protein n=1 Tax=Silvimonas terrae TaxID=300266 RepID=A0A840RE81_9NEIS|nr:hypothetical protein [Silvimonas terrae]MBB5190663.1 hypothetical protein [Silvimonas terrae]
MDDFDPYDPLGLGLTNDAADEKPTASGPSEKLGVSTFWEQLHAQQAGKVKSVQGVSLEGLLLKSYDELKSLKTDFRTGNDGSDGRPARPARHLSPGVIYVRAIPFWGGSGHALIGSLEPGPGHSERVYFVPWKKYETVHADRNWFENSNCNYFMTTPLSGCRFVLTHNQVLHVAADASYSPEPPYGTGDRTKAEHAVTGGAPSRRLSQTSSSGGFRYKKTSVVFGMRTPTGWVYKAYRHAEDDWVIFDEPPP